MQIKGHHKGIHHNQQLLFQIKMKFAWRVLKILHKIALSENFQNKFKTENLTATNKEVIVKDKKVELNLDVKLS